VGPVSLPASSSTTSDGFTTAPPGCRSGGRGPRAPRHLRGRGLPAVGIEGSASPGRGVVEMAAVREARTPGRVGTRGRPGHRSRGMPALGERSPSGSGDGSASRASARDGISPLPPSPARQSARHGAQPARGAARWRSPPGGHGSREAAGRTGHRRPRRALRLGELDRLGIQGGRIQVAEPLRVDPRGSAEEDRLGRLGHRTSIMAHGAPLRVRDDHAPDCG